MKSFFTRTLAAAFLLATSLSASAEDVIPGRLRLAREFAAHTQPENNLHFSTGTRSLLLPTDPGANGAYVVKTDCIGFVEQMIKRGDGVPVPKPSTKKFKSRYSIIDYVDAVSNGEIFTRLTRIDELKAGDVVMWKYAPGFKKSDTLQANGHALMLDGTPQRVSNKFFSKSWSLTQYRVRIIDSSDYPKSDDDSRLQSGQHLTGVGTGTFDLYADDAGVVQGVSFDFAQAPIRRLGTDYIIVMARP